MLFIMMVRSEHVQEATCGLHLVKMAALISLEIIIIIIIMSFHQRNNYASIPNFLRPHVLSLIFLLWRVAPMLFHAAINL